MTTETTTDDASDYNAKTANTGGQGRFCRGQVGRYYCKGELIVLEQ